MADREVRFHPLASAEAERARAWYAARSQKASELFLNELDVAVESVREQPERWAFIRGTARRKLFRKFPFSLVYRATPEAIDVIAVAHHRRRPGYWSRRK